MARAAIVERELKREKLVDKYKAKREAIKGRLKSLYARLDDASDKELEVIYADIEEAQLEFDALPRNASPKRKRNRCQLTGRPRGVYRRFKLCRNMIRKFAMMGLLPGVLKSSW